MKLKLSLLLTLLCLFLNARPPDTKALMERGHLLYRLELASWYGTDNFLANFPELHDSVGGYLSYITPQEELVNIFYNRADPAKVLVRFKFESIPNAYPIAVDSKKADLTALEKDLINLRAKAIEQIEADTEDFFSMYENTQLNPIPLIIGKERMVYILSATQTAGIVLIGNDYLLTFNKNNEFKKKHKFHNSLLKYPYQAEDGEPELTSTYHTHVFSEVIDATDICTLLLYKDYVQWKTHYVFSDQYISIFDLEKEELKIMKTKDWQRLQELSENDGPNNLSRYHLR